MTEHDKLRTMMYKHVKILRCSRPEFEGTVQKVYVLFSNGIDFVTRYGLVFVPDGDYEAVE